MLRSFLCRPPQLWSREASSLFRQASKLIWSRSPPLPCLPLPLPPHGFASYQHVQPSCRGSTLSPGDAPLLPGQCIEGAGGFHKLGWIPGLSWKPKLVISLDGDMIAQRHDGSEVRAHTVPTERVPSYFFHSTTGGVFGLLVRGTPLSLFDLCPLCSLCAQEIVALFARARRRMGRGGVGSGASAMRHCSDVHGHHAPAPASVIFQPSFICVVHNRAPCKTG